MDDRIVRVVLSADQGSVAQIAAAVNSVLMHTASHVMVVVITLPDSVVRIDSVLSHVFPAIDLQVATDKSVFTAALNHIRITQVVPFDPSRVEGKISVRGSRKELSHPVGMMDNNNDNNNNVLLLCI